MTIRKPFILLLATALFLGCQSNAPAKFKTIMLRSYGEIEVLPNTASFRINLSCLEKNIKSSKQCLVEKSNELNDRLASFGIHTDDILTTSVDMNRSYTWRNNSRVFEGYNSSTTVHVTVRDIGKLDEIYTELLENRNLDLGWLSYSHSNLDSLKNEAYLDALNRSAVLAEKLLENLPESSKEILKIGNVEISASTPQTAEFKESVSLDMRAAVQADAEISQNSSIAIGKGTVQVHATLYVEYQIK